MKFFIFSGKGIGRVRIEPKPNTTVDVFVTHTIADGTKMANETWYRIKQAEELVDSYLKKSTADAIILGGDFNAPPILNPGMKTILFSDIVIKMGEITPITN